MVKPSRLTLCLVLSWFVIGAVATVTGFVGLLYPIISLLLLIPAGLMIASAVFVIKKFKILSLVEQLLIFWLGGIWLLHFTGIFTPEVGFDAVWYHLPIVQQFAAAHRIFYLSDYYQSLNPLFSDLLFLLGFQVAGEAGAKFIAYGLALTLAIVSYQLARTLLSRRMALFFLVSLSLIQVITWQASSFYIDVAKALWEVAALWTLITMSKKRPRVSLLMSALLLGASLASKTFSLVLLPFFSWLVYAKTKSVRLIITFLSLAIAVALPFYAFAFAHSGSLFPSIELHLAKVGEIGAGSSFSDHFQNQTRRLPLSPIVFLTARDYVSPLVLIGVPLCFWFWRKKLLPSPIVILLLFGGMQWLIWWFVPPLSTRYALSGFMALLLVSFWGIDFWLSQYSHNKNKYKNAVLFFILVINLALLLPRLIVFKRNLPFLLGRQSKAEFVSQFSDGWIDPHLRRWHQLN